jgi:hypothetical protein
MLLTKMSSGVESFLLRCHVDSYFNLNTPGVLQLVGYNDVVQDRSFSVAASDI